MPSSGVHLPRFACLHAPSYRAWRPPAMHVYCFFCVVFVVGCMCALRRLLREQLVCCSKGVNSFRVFGPTLSREPLGLWDVAAVHASNPKHMWCCFSCAFHGRHLNPIWAQVGSVSRLGCSPASLVLHCTGTFGQCSWVCDRWIPCANQIHFVRHCLAGVLWWMRCNAGCKSTITCVWHPHPPAWLPLV